MNPTQEWLTRPGGPAERLRNVRANAGLSGKELAEQAGWAPSKVSRIENGGQVPTEDDVSTWARICGLDETFAEEVRSTLREILSARSEWRRRLRSGQASVQRDYNELVAASDRICYFETVWIPGLLQTPEYARLTFAGIAALHGTSKDEVDGAVAARMERQRHLYDPGKRFEFLLAEPVLRWLLCPPAVMRGQLDRLQTVVGLSNVRFGVLPMGVQLSTVPQNSFQIYGDTAIVETFTTEDRSAGAEMEKYEEILKSLWSEAVEGDGARALLTAAAESLPAA